jgi:hypothetical protein
MKNTRRFPQFSLCTLRARLFGRGGVNLRAGDFGGIALRFLGLALLFGLVAGATCTKDELVDVVVTADVTATFHAQGEINVYSGETTVDLSQEIDLDQIAADNGLDEIKGVTLEAVFHRVSQPDPNPLRTVSDNVFTVREGTGANRNLFTLDSVLVNDPAFQDWTPVPLDPAGTAVINSALFKLVHSIPTAVTFTISGVSSPTSVPTDFWWEAKVRFQVVATKKITVIEPV